MRLRITLDTEQQPISYEYHGFIQGMIYHALNTDTATALHDRGFGTDRIYKLFVFSELSGKYLVKNDKLVFTEPVNFYISSVYAKMLNELYNFFNEHETIAFGDKTFKILSAEPVADFEYNENHEYVLRTLSPITAYMTDDKNFTTYFNPKSEAFETSLHDNLLRKYITLYRKKPDDADDFFEILSADNCSEHISRYKMTNYNAYMCTLRIKTSDVYLKLLMHTGLGAVNSAGYGMMCMAERQD